MRLAASPNALDLVMPQKISAQGDLLETRYCECAQRGTDRSDARRCDGLNTRREPPRTCSDKPNALAKRLAEGQSA